MKIGEAQQSYREQGKLYQEQKAALTKQLQKIQARMAASPMGREQYGSEAAVLELSLKDLAEKQKENQDYLNLLSAQQWVYQSMEEARQQAQTGQENIAEVGKILEVARRIMRGGIVPASDEKKLMEYSSDLYQAAKNIGAMMQRRKREKFDSLWKDEEKEEYGIQEQTSEDMEAPPGGPELNIESGTAVPEESL